MLLVASLVVFLSLYNNVTAWAPLPAWTYVPLNTAVAVVLVGLARAAGIGWADLGMSRAAVPSGIRIGIAATLVIAAGIALAFFIPGAQRFLADQRVAGLTAGGLAYTALLRIPVGTALFEEATFRGVLYGAWAEAASPWTAALGSSLVFGIWHIGPTLVLLQENGFGGSTWARGLLVAGSVAGTAAGGLILVAIRIRTQGIVGPFLVHAAANSLAIVAAYVWQRS